jgi:hypothetical protein
LSTKEYDKLIDDFYTIKIVVNSFTEENYKNFFLYNKNLINKLMFAYNDQEELIEKKYLLKSYLHQIEISMTEENENYIDSNKIKLISLKKAIDILNERIKKNQDFLNENEHALITYEKSSIFKDIVEDCHKVKYKYFDCDMCFDKFSCTGTTPSGKYRQKNFGSFGRLENNIIQYKDGSRCFYYNKQFSAKIFIQCGTTETIAFKEKLNGCEYHFIYTTKMGCNSIAINQIKEKIKVYLKDV